MKTIFALLISLLITIAVIAQESCAIEVTEALSTMRDVCDTTSRNELCYGNTDVSVTSEIENLDFSEPGDVVSINDVTRIRTSPYNEPDEWGVAVMKVQANIPDTLPGQNVTFLLFGQVDLRNAGVVSTILIARTTGGINVRSGPSTNYAIAGSLEVDTELEAIGRNATGDWVYIKEANISGWVFASLLNIDGDVLTLDEVANDFTSDAPTRPMQAVYLSTGIRGTTCEDVPQDGVLIQTPDTDIELVINDIGIRLGSTVYISTQADGFMTLYVLEGEAALTAFSVVKIVPEGSFARVPIDSDLRASGIPTDPQPYDTDDLQQLPIDGLDEAIAIAEPADASDITFANRCRFLMVDSATIRTGPGDVFPSITIVPPTRLLTALGRTTRDTGDEWWQYTNGTRNNWINVEDLISTQAACDTLPDIDPPEEPIASISTRDLRVSGFGSRFNLNDCSGGIQRVSAGASIEIFISFGGNDIFDSLQEARNHGASGWIAVNGTRYNIDRTGAYSDAIGHHYTLHSEIGTLPIGTYYAAGEISGGIPAACMVVVE